MLTSRCSSICRLWRSNPVSLRKATLYTGKATPEGTHIFCSSSGFSSKMARAVLPRSNWNVARIGFSGCKLDPNSSEHKSSLSAVLFPVISNPSSRDAALASTTNFVSIPSSAEALLGKTLSPLIDSRDITREQLVVSVKMGILRAPQLKELHTSFEQADIYNVNHDLHKYMYCISPEFLEYKITDTLKVLDLDCIDLVLLDDPVFNFLQEHEGSTEEMYNRIIRAFEYLESEVAAGRIQYYGISSDSFILPSTSPHHLSLSRLIDTARTKNLRHFAAVEYQHNIVESGAVTIPNNRNNTITVSQLAKENNLMQIGHRPLTVNQHGRQFRLKSLTMHENRDIHGLMNESFKFATTLEKHSPVALQDELNINFSYPDIFDVLWTQHLGANLLDGAHYLYKYLNWVELEARPRLERACRQLAKHERFILWSVRYKSTIDGLLTRCQWALECVACDTTKRVAQRLSQKSPCLTGIDLSHQALRVALSGGPDIVLCGLRRHANLVHTSQLDQTIRLTEAELHDALKDTKAYSNFMRTDDAYAWLEPGELESKVTRVYTVSFGEPVEEGSVSDLIRKWQAANPIKFDSPIY